MRGGSTVVEDESLFASSVKMEAEAPLPVWVPVLAIGILLVLAGRRKTNS